MSHQYFRLCFFWRRIFKLRKAEPPEDIKQVFQEYSENGTMSIDNLHRFLREFQGEHNATTVDAQAIFDSVKHLNILQRKGFNLEAFFRYLFGDLNLSHSPSLRVHHDMNAPLAHYFIYTGHNSYLSGSQHFSSSGVEPIIKALEDGVRVIELDLWPNSLGDDVDVRHGGTTTPVSLIKCLKSIKTHAFCASFYPLMITFEDHLTPELQAKVAHMVTQTFESMLFFPESDLQELPSPESLKLRILISTKLPKEDVPIAVSKYRHIVSIPAVKLKGGIENFLTANTNKAIRVSLSEQDLEVAVKEHGIDIVRFTQRNLLRVYPKSTRIDSSNYDPLVGWMHGAQLIAFNMQGYGKHLWTMQGMFRANGGCGYVKKPDFLLNVGLGARVLDPHTRLPIKKTLKVKVYMGEGWHSEFRHTHFDRYSPPDFFTKVGITGVPADSSSEITQAIEDEWVPKWNEEFEFPLRVPEMALFWVKVKEYDIIKKHDFGGQTCLPISELRTGIRSIPLHNHKGEKYKFAKLLMSFKFV